MDRLPVVRVAEIAFLTIRTQECAEFYRGLGLDFEADPDLRHIHFADVGEQYFGFAHADRGFFTGYGEEMTKTPLHVAFEVPGDSIDECISFLESKGVEHSPRVENSDGWHNAAQSSSVYFTDPAGNIMELWAPNRRELPSKTGVPSNIR